MSLCALGLPRSSGRRDRVNALWPRTLIATAAVQNLLGGDDAMAAARKPRCTRTPPTRSSPGPAAMHGQHLPLRGRAAEEGVTDFDAYAYVPGATPQVDLFVDHV